MEDKLNVRISVGGLATDPAVAAQVLVNRLKRALFQVTGHPGEFTAEITVFLPGDLDGTRTALVDGEWQRVRDSNSRGFDTNRASNAAP